MRILLKWKKKLNVRNKIIYMDEDWSFYVSRIIFSFPFYLSFEDVYEMFKKIVVYLFKKGCPILSMRYPSCSV